MVCSVVDNMVYMGTVKYSDQYIACEIVMCAVDNNNKNRQIGQFLKGGGTIGQTTKGNQFF